jgi:hypothetical protein
VSERKSLLCNIAHDNHQEFKKEREEREKRRQKIFYLSLSLSLSLSLIIHKNLDEFVTFHGMLAFLNSRH